MSAADGADDARLLTAPPDLRLDGKVAWVTGASRGLGRAVAFALAGAGAEVLLTARSADRLDDVIARIRDHGGVAHALAGSIADEADVAAAAALAQQTWGRLDVLVNNAGVSPVFARAEKVSDEAWQEVIDTNLTGTLRCCRAVLPLMEAAGGGAIVNVSSIHGQVAYERLIAYAASKGGLEMVTRTLAVEWAERGIRVNSVAPGYLVTDMTTALRGSDHWREAFLAKIPMRRFGDVAELAATILFLAAPASSYVTGTTLFADGGWTAG